MTNYKAKSKYKYVSVMERKGKIEYRGIYTAKSGKKNGKNFPTEREAAIYVDKMLIEMGKEPVNILKRK